MLNWSKEQLAFLRDAAAFQSAVLHALDGDTPVLAAVKPKDTAFLKRIRAHPNAELVLITEQNRDELYERLLPKFLQDCVEKA